MSTYFMNSTLALDTFEKAGAIVDQP